MAAGADWGRGQVAPLTRGHRRTIFDIVDGMLIAPIAGERRALATF